MYRILLTEDEEVNREMLTQWLEDQGYIVLHAADGEACLEIAALHRPDLILLDMRMPKVDGYAAARMLKADADLRRVPVIGVSAYADSDSRRRALDAGCDGYHTKPVDFTSLSQLMLQLLAPLTVDPPLAAAIPALGAGAVARLQH